MNNNNFLHMTNRAQYSIYRKKQLKSMREILKQTNIRLINKKNMFRIKIKLV